MRRGSLGNHRHTPDYSKELYKSDKRNEISNKPYTFCVQNMQKIYMCTKRKMTQETRGTKMNTHYRLYPKHD